MRRTNEAGSRDRSGLPESTRLFIDMAKLPLPLSEDKLRFDLRITLRELMKMEEAWLSELALANILSDSIPEAGNPALVQPIVEAIQAHEKSRIALNDYAREANAYFPSVCNLEPLPVYQ
jgi:hypothetical protein